MSAVLRQSSSRERFDVVVIGCGPAGAIAAYDLARSGLSVLALEREPFPRYHIGESLTGVAGDFVHELGLTDAMAKLDFPDKPGVKVIGRDARHEFFVPVQRPTWQVRRAEFDALVLARAVDAGAEHRYGSVRQIVRDGERIAGVVYRGREENRLRRVLADAVIDCSGHSALLSRHEIAGPRQVDAFGRQIAVFTQYRGAARDPGSLGNATVIFFAERHHWAWFIPVSSELVSVGVVLPASMYKNIGNDPATIFDWGIQNLNPDLTRRLEGCERVEPHRVIRNYSYRIEPFAGPGWMCVGDAHRFSDPIFSFGVSFAMREARAAVETVLRARSEGWTEPLADYVAFSDRGQDVAFDLIRYFWRFAPFFSYQLRGPHRGDMIRLFAGDCFDPEPVRFIRDARESLAGGVDAVPAGLPREIASTVMDRWCDFQGILASYLETKGDDVLLSFVLDGDYDQLEDSLQQFEDELYARYGRSHLAVMHWCPEVCAVPPFADAYRLYDRRAG